MVVHVVRDVVKVEEPIHEVAAHAELGEGRFGIAHGGEQPGLETMERVAFLLGEVAAAEKPSLALGRGLLSVTIISQLEGAVRDEVWNEYLGR